MMKNKFYPEWKNYGVPVEDSYKNKNKSENSTSDLK